MKKIGIASLFFFLIFIVIANDLDARGGRGGGGRGGSRGGGARQVQRSPSMSRVQSRPASRPTGQRVANRPASRDNVQQFMRNNPGATRQAAANRSAIRDNQGRRDAIGRNVRDNVRDNRHDRNNWYNDRFWNDHNFHGDYIGHGNWWRAATAASVVGWLGWGGYPSYYDYGYSDGGYYWSPYESYGTTQTTTEAPPSYPEQSQAIDTAASKPVSSDSDWMSLGVFALTENSESTATPTIYFQLALNRKGIISGSVYNTSTDSLREVIGMADEDTKRAAWKVTDKTSAPIIETGLYNLTQSEAPALVHFGDGKTQEMLLVRIDKE